MSNNNDAAIALLEKYFDIAFASPDGVKKLRELILSLAMQGKLVAQDINDQPVSELLKEIEAEKKRLIKEGKIKQSKPLPEIKPDEVPYDLPKGWEWVRLNNVFDVRDGTHDTPKYVEIGYPLITSKNLYTGVLSFEDVKFISEEDYRKINERSRVDIGDIIFAMIGSIGNPVIVDCSEDFSIKNVALFKFYSTDKPSGRYLHYFLKKVQESMRANSSGAVQSFVSLGFLRNYLFPLPPLAEQRRIVAKIDELMARCDRLEKLRGDRDRKQIAVHNSTLNRLLIAKEQSEFNTAWQFITQHFSELYAVKENVTELRKAILQLAVMGKLVPQDPSDQPASELLKEIKKEKERLVKEGKIKLQKSLPKITPEEIPHVIPNKWIWVRMDDLCPGITSGSTPPNHIFSDKEGIPFLKVYNIRNHKIDFSYKPQFISEEYHLKSKRSCLKPGDVIMNIVGPPLGKVAIIPDDFPEYNCNQAIVFFRPTVDFLNKYLYLYLLSGKFLDKIELIGTAGQDNISVTKSRSILIPLPPLAEQQRIVAKIAQLMALCDNLEKQIDAANSKQTNLLNAVMTKI